VVCQGAIGREVEMARTSRSQWLTLSRRTVVIRSLTACATGAAAALLHQLRKLPPRWLRRRWNIRTHQRATRSAAIALSSRSRTPARSSTARSVRRGGVNSGSKRQARRGRSPADTYTKRRGTPAVTASPCPHAPQIEGAFETINPATVGTAFQ